MLVKFVNFIVRSSFIIPELLSRSLDDMFFFYAQSNGMIQGDDDDGRDRLVNWQSDNLTRDGSSIRGSGISVGAKFRANCFLVSWISPASSRRAASRVIEHDPAVLSLLLSGCQKSARRLFFIITRNSDLSKCPETAVALITVLEPRQRRNNYNNQGTRLPVLLRCFFLKPVVHLPTG